jgi:hypothetical protein
LQFGVVVACALPLLTLYHKESGQEFIIIIIIMSRRSLEYDWSIIISLKPIVMHMHTAPSYDDEIACLI